MPILVQNQNINIRKRPELAAAVSTQCHQTIILINGCFINTVTVNIPECLINIPAISMQGCQGRLYGVRPVKKRLSPCGQMRFDMSGQIFTGIAKWLPDRVRRY